MTHPDPIQARLERILTDAEWLRNHGPERVFRAATHIRADAAAALSTQHSFGRSPSEGKKVAEPIPCHDSEGLSVVEVG